MKYLDEIPGLDLLRQNRAFVRLGSRTEDFAITFDFAWVITDSIRTIVAIKSEPDLKDKQISRAWLTDDQHHAFPLMDIRELSEEGAQKTGFPDHRIILFFGPMAKGIRKMRLEIEQVEPSAPGLRLFHPIVDPLADIDDEEALHIMAWEEPDDPMTPIPIGTVAGCWAFEVNYPRTNLAWDYYRHFIIDKTVNLAGNLLHLVDIKRGLTGWLLTTKFDYPNSKDVPEDELLKLTWSVGSPEELINYLTEREMLEAYAPPLLKLSLKCGDQVVECQDVFGPLSPLGNKFYHFFPLTENQPEAVVINQLYEMPLPEAWVYEFNPKNIETPSTQLCYDCEPFHFDLELNIEGIFWEENMMLLYPNLTVYDTTKAEIAVADCVIFDPNYNPYYCLGQSLAELPEPKANIQRTQVYGWQYPPIHRLMEWARFEVHTVTITPKEPIVIPLDLEEKI